MLSLHRFSGKRNKFRLSLMISLFAALLIVTACSPSGSGKQESPSAKPADGQKSGPKKGGTLILMGHQEVASLSPDDIGPTVQWAAITQIHNAMLEVDHDYNLDKVLAEDYQVSPDGLKYTFKLRKGVKFHDGTEFTADDVKYTFDFYGNKENNTVSAPNFRAVKETKVVDKHTVEVHMKEPDATFLIRGATMFIVPKAYHSSIGEKAYKGKPIGTGAFKVKEWKADQYTLLEAFDDHFRGRPHLDFFRLNVVPEPSVRAIALDTGDAHGSVWPLTTEDNLRFAKNSAFTVIKSPSTAVNHFPLNNSLPQLSDKRVRQALMHALDRQRIINDVFKGAATLATSNLAPSFQTWYEPNVKQYPYDVAKAKALLDEAGWKVGADGVREKDGVKLAFTVSVISGDQVRKPEAEMLQQMLKQVGVNVEIREAPVATILSGLPKGDLHASLFNWTYGGTGGEPDPFVTLHSTGARNFNQYKNAEVDKLIEAGLREADVTKRKAIYSQIQKIVAEDVPFLYICFWDGYDVFSGKVKGLPKSAGFGSGLYRLAHQWWLE